MQDFDHEKLVVYQKAIHFVAWSSELLKNVPKSSSVNNQLDRASTSIPLNLAEGNGKFTPADRCRYFDIARGSALEGSACLDVLVAKQTIGPEEADLGKKMLVDIVSMIIGLIRSSSKERTV